MGKADTPAHATFRSRADLHMHTTCSDGAATVPEVLAAVARAGDLAVIAITDHDTIAGAELARQLVTQRGYRFEVIVGAEITSREGHIVGLFLQGPIAPGQGAAATVAAIHAQGGLAFAPHPFFRDRPRRQRRAMDALGTLTARLPFDAIEVDNSTPFLEWSNLRARRFAQRHSLSMLGASDAHILEAIGKSYTTFSGRTSADLRRAIEHGETTVGTKHYTPRELAAYFHFWCGYGHGKRTRDDDRTTRFPTAGATRRVKPGHNRSATSRQRAG